MDDGKTERSGGMLKWLGNPMLSSLYTLTALVSANWFLPIFDSLLSETDFASRIEIITYVAAVVALQLLLCGLVARYYTWFGAKHLPTLLLALILTINLIGLLLSFHDPFLSQKRGLRIGEIIMLTAAFYWLMKILRDRKALAGGLSLLYAVMVAQQLATLALPNDAESTFAVEDQLKIVRFERKPNVYLLSFDSLIPPANASEYLGIDNLAYVTVLDELAAQRFPNVFSDQDMTKTSLNATLFLDPAVGAMHDTSKETSFSGQSPNPLFGIFKANGYRIVTAYAGQYMLHGKYVDDFISNEVSTSYCKFAIPWYYFQHLGYCSFKLNVLIPLNAESAPRKKSRNFRFAQQILDHIAGLKPEDGPWLNYLYIYEPGHTDRNYLDSPEERKKFSQTFDKKQRQLSQYLRQLLETIHAKDPGAIVLIFGDHGPWLSRGMEINGETAAFIIRDRHAVVAAIHPRDACQDHMGASAEEPFVTPGKLIRQLVVCLAGGDDPLDRKVDYSGPYEGYPFGDFLYE